MDMEDADDKGINPATEIAAKSKGKRKGKPVWQESKPESKKSKLEDEQAGGSGDGAQSQKVFTIVPSKFRIEYQSSSKLIKLEMG